MISEFESRLADTLGARMPGALKGHVDVAPGADPGAGVRLVLGVTSAQLVEPDMGSRRSEVLPGSVDPRRAVRITCTVSVEVRTGTGDRTDQMKALDAAVYELEAPDFRNGTALADGTDRGFLIQSMQPSVFAAPLQPKLDPALPMAVALEATGLFWPVGVVGVSGTAISEVRFRGTLPLDLTASAPLVAGGAAATLTIQFGTASMRIKQDGTTKLPFDVVAVTLESAGGKPGKGTLTGGTAGADAAVRIINVNDGLATVSYTPPAAATSEELIVAFENGEKGLGVEIGRATLRTEAAP